MYPVTCLVACLFVGVSSQTVPTPTDPQFQPIGGGTFDALLQSMFKEGKPSKPILNQGEPVEPGNTQSEHTADVYPPPVDTSNTQHLIAPEAYTSIDTINAEIARLRKVQQSLINKKNQAPAPKYNQQSGQSNFATSAYDAQQNQQNESPVQQGQHVGVKTQYNAPQNSNNDALTPNNNSPTASNIDATPTYNKPSTSYSDVIPKNKILSSDVIDVMPNKTPNLGSTLDATPSASNIDAKPIYNKKSASGIGTTTPTSKQSKLANGNLASQNIKPKIVKEPTTAVDVSILKKAGPPYKTAIDTNLKTQPNTFQKHKNEASQPITKPSEIKPLHYKSQPTQLNPAQTQEAVPKSSPGAAKLPLPAKDALPETKTYQPVEPLNSPNIINTQVESTAATKTDIEAGFNKVFSMLKQLKTLSAVNPRMKNMLSGMITASQGYMGTPLAEKALISQNVKPIVEQKQSVNVDKGPIVYPTKSTNTKQTVVNKPKQPIKKPTNAFYDMSNQKNANPPALPNGLSSQISTSKNLPTSPNANLHQSSYGNSQQMSNSQPLVQDASANNKQMSAGRNTGYEPQTVQTKPSNYPNSYVPPPSSIQYANNQQLYPNSNMPPQTVNQPPNNQHSNVPSQTLNQPANNQQLYPNSNMQSQTFNSHANNQQQYPTSYMPQQESNQPASNQQQYPTSYVPPQESYQPASNQQQYPNSNVPPQNIPSGTNIYTDPSQHSGMPSNSANPMESTYFDQLHTQIFGPTTQEVNQPPNPTGGPQQQGTNGVFDANPGTNLYPNTLPSLGLNNMLSPMGNAGSLDSLMTMMASQGMPAAQGNSQGNGMNQVPMMAAQLKLMKIQAKNRMHKALRQAIISTGQTNNIFGKMLYETAMHDRSGAYGINGIASPIRDMEYVQRMKTLERLTAQEGALNGPQTGASSLLLLAINKNRRLHRGVFDPESMLETLLRT